jgi:TolB-like protein/Flp pilus assembly protein TadD
MIREVRDDPIIRAELERVLSSPAFVRSDRLSRFLRFLVERHLDGREDELKESVIAVEICGRSPDYDPKLDSIVRTEAGRLRARLLEYYAREGSGDPVAIDVPKGGYRPVFRYRNAGGRHRRFWLAAVAGVSALLIAAGWWSVQPRRGPVRIAVLPLDNVSPEAGNESFADGLTDEIINNLSVVDGLEVRSGTSSFAFKGKSRNLANVAKQLDADFVLEGSVARASNRVRINARLVRARDDVAVWAGEFERPVSDLLAIQDEISNGIVNNLRLKLSRGVRRYETSVDAYDAYLLGRALSQHRDDPPAVFESIGYFEAAIAKDRSFAPAYAALASMYAYRSIQFVLDHPADELSKMRTAAEKAIQLDPLLAEGHDAVGMTYARAGQWEPAEKSFRRAIELNPNRSPTYAHFGIWLLWVCGRNAEAIEQLRLAEKADPISGLIRFYLGSVLISAERYDEAAAVCSKLPAGRPGRDVCLARAMFAKGNSAQAIQLLANASDALRNPESRGFLGYFYARAGRRDDAARLAARSTYPNEQALIFAGLGDKDRTFEALDRMQSLGAQRVGIHLNYPEITSSLRGDPRLRALYQKIGLVR